MTDARAAGGLFYDEHMGGGAMADIVERLRRAHPDTLTDDEVLALFGAAAAEIERLRAEAASLRLTLGGRTFSAAVPEPIGCPLPGACSTVAEIERLRAEVEEISASAVSAWAANGRLNDQCAAIQAERDRLREAQRLAANRLDRLALEQQAGSARRYEVCEWVAEARAALGGGRDVSDHCEISGARLPRPGRGESLSMDKAAAFRAGAEAMREAAAGVALQMTTRGEWNLYRWSDGPEIARSICALPVLEDKR